MMVSTSSFNNSGEELASQPFSQRVFASVCRIVNAQLNKSILYIKSRWIGFFLLLCLYIIRVYYYQGFYVISYGLGIFLLNLLIGFISPQIDPETDEYVLPVSGVSQISTTGNSSKIAGGYEHETGEFRPFVRQIPEFKCWLSATKATLLSLFLTIFPFFDLPVFWPILLFYFVLLFVLNMKEQIKRMVKYKYLPFSWGKQTYGDITRCKSSNSPNSKEANSKGLYASTQDRFVTPYVLR